jgi:hypothetical protein
MGAHGFHEAQEEKAQAQQAREDRVLTPEARLQQKEQDQAAIQMWTEVLQEELRAFRRWRFKQRMRWVLRAGLLALALYMIISGKGGAWMLWLFFGLGAAVDVRAGMRYQAVSELAKTRDPRAAGVLAVAWRDGDNEVRQTAARALKEILPRLHASDSARFAADTMNAIVSLLLSEDPELLLAALQGLEQIGDEHAIPAIQGMRETWKEALPYIRDPQGREAYQRLVEAAESCLTAIGARAQKERQRQTLLRPAQNPDSPAETLLRPAGSVSTPPEQLLRPADPEDSQEDT